MPKGGAGFFFSGGMDQELRDRQDHEGEAEGDGDDGVQEIAQTFVGFEKLHGEISVSIPPRLANERNIGAIKDFLGQVFASEV
jgi:hypothetical protein